MLIELHDTADPNFVKSALCDMGLWPRTLQGPAGKTRAFWVLPESNPVDSTRVSEIDGVVDVLTAEPTPGCRR